MKSSVAWAMILGMTVLFVAQWSFLGYVAWLAISCLKKYLAS